MAKVFIAGPVNKSNYGKQVNAVALKLKEMHLMPINPGDLPRDMPNREYINNKLKLLMEADMMCMLPDSNNSCIASFFKAYAGTVRMPILHAELINGSWYIR